VECGEFGYNGEFVLCSMILNQKIVVHCEIFRFGVEVTPLYKALNQCDIKVLTEIVELQY
jgi:hypothetical protein